MTRSLKHHEIATPRPFILSVPSFHKGYKGPVEITFLAGPPLAAKIKSNGSELHVNLLYHIPHESQTTKPHRLFLPRHPRAYIFSPQTSRPPGACWVGLKAWISNQC